MAGTSHSTHGAPPRRVIPTAFSPALAGAREVVALVARLADTQGRDDLVGELHGVTEDLAVESVPVLVIGGAGQGKSSLVNALVGAPVSTVSTSRGTAVPVEISHGTSYLAEVTGEPRDGRPSTEGDTRSVPFGVASALAAHEYNPGNERRLRLVAVTAPSSALARGLTLVDTPSITDAWSGPSPRLLRSAAGAAAVVLVSSAADVLADGELDLLRITSSLCSRQIVVVNGANRYPDWASVVERNELLLEQRGISAAVFAVDPSPYWAANGGLPPGPDPGMHELAAHLERAVLETEQLRISRALTETFWVADRLKMRLSAERAVIDNAARADAARARLRSASQAAHDLCRPDATWLVRLHARMERLQADLDTDLDADLRRLREEAAALAATAARSGDWDGAFAALHHRLADAVAYRQRVLRFSIRALSREVTETFHGEWSEIIAATEISPEAHALVTPRLTRAALAGPRSLAATELWPDASDRPPPPMGGVPEGMVAWLTNAEQLVRHEMHSALTRSSREIEARCGARGLELHRSLVEVLTSLSLLGQLDSTAVTQRRRSLVSDLEQLHTMDWRVS